MTVPVPDQLEYISDANGVTKDFPYPKRFLQKDEVVVALRDADGIDTPQILGTHYTIAGSSWPTGGTVSFINAPQAPNKVVRYRMTEAKQTVGLANNQRNDAPSVELQLDRLTMALQDRGARGEITWLALLAEIVARKAGDKQLSDRINAEEAARIAADLLERAQRISADSAINQRVDKEILDRINGDNALSSLIGAWGPLDRNFYDTKLAASLAFIAPSVSHLFTGGSFAAGDGPIGVWARDNTLTPGGFTSRDGTYWSNISPVMDFLQFGADPTGMEVSDEAMRLCVDRASETGSRIEQKHGRFLWRHQQLNLMVDADLRGATFVLDGQSGVKPSSWGMEAIFVVKPTTEKIIFSAVELADLNENYRSQMVTNAFRINHPLIANYRDAYVQFYTETVDILRGDGTDRKIFDHVITGAEGMLTIGLDRSFTSAPITHCVIYPREIGKRYFYPPVFEAYDPGSIKCVRVERSNTYVGKFEWVEKLGPSEYYARGLVEFADCIDVEFDEGAAEGQRKGGAAYTISGGRGLRIKWRKYDAVDGWGTVGTNEIKDGLWEDCGLSRIDVHWGARGINRAVRCTLKQGASTIGGSGKFSMVDCTYIIGPAATTADNASGGMLAARADYGNEFFGEFEVIRPRIVIAREITESVFNKISIVRAGGPVTYDPGRDVSLPNVTVQDPMIVGAATQGLTTNGLVIVACDLTDAKILTGDGTRKMIYPSTVRVTGGSFHGFVDQARVTLEAVRANAFALAGTEGRRTRNLPGETNCDIYVEGVPQLVPNRVAPKSNASPHLLDFKLSVSNWATVYQNGGSKIWYPRITLIGCTKASLLVPLKATIYGVGNEIILLDDEYGSRANTNVNLSGGSIRPHIVSEGSENEFIRANLIMTGVSVIPPRKPDGTLGTFDLFSAKGSGNVLMEGVHAAPGANVYGWDTNCANFWAL